MTYEELLDKGLIKRIKPSPSQVKDRLKLAKRDISRPAGKVNIKWL